MWQLVMCIAQNENKEYDTDGVILGQMPGDLEVSIEDLCQVAGDMSRGWNVQKTEERLLKSAKKSC